MPFPDLSRLVAQLNASNLQQTNPQLYQVIKQLIDNLKLIEASILADISGNSGNIDELLDVAFLTAADASALLVNSRQLLAGTNITFDDTTPNQRTINASGGGSSVDHVVLSNGDVADPKPVNDGAGNFIYIPYIP